MTWAVQFIEDSMKTTRNAFLICAVLGLCTLSYADDFDDFGDFGGFGDASSPAAAASSVKIGGEVSLEGRAYLDTDSAKTGVNLDGLKDMTTQAFPMAKLNFSYSGSSVDANVNLKISEDSLTENKWDLLDEAVIRGYFCENKLTVEAGKMRTIWGKGDRLHVIDNFNADDYSEFIVPLYSDRRISVPMFKATYALPANNLTLEAVVTPGMTPDRFASSGRWVSGKMNTLRTLTETAVKTNLYMLQAKKDASFDTAEYMDATSNYLSYLTYANEINSNPELIFPDTESLEYSQAGLRVTGTFGSVDVGASYYYGHHKQPSANLANLAATQAMLNKGISTLMALPELDYDKKQTFGLEASTILWHFNLRAEACYNLTDDTSGNDPWVKNNSIQWLFGFDIDLPVSNINVNVQETGTYILNNDKIDGVFKTYDVDYDSDDCYTNNRLVVNITDSWKNGKIKPEATIVYGIERGDLVVMPKVEFCPNQDISFTISGLLMHSKNDESEFADWSGEKDGYFNNSYASVGVKCKF